MGRLAGGICAGGSGSRYNESEDAVRMIECGSGMLSDHNYHEVDPLMVSSRSEAGEGGGAYGVGSKMGG